MAWADVIARGSGRTEYRLVIEGYATEWVTASDLAGASPDGRTRRVGLKRQSLSFGDRIVPIEAKLEGNGVTAEIVDIDGQATREFARRGAILATLKVNLGSLLTDTGMTVSNTSQFVAGQHYHINTECFLVSTIDSSTGLTVGRRKRQTLEQAHFAFDGGGESVQAPITDHPITTRGRRCYLYGYGDGEAGDGTLIWRGKITAPPSRNGMTSWHLNIDPIVSVFDQETSSKDLRPTHVRGYYFPWNCALTIAFAEYERFDGFDLPSGLKARHDLKLTGFYPDQGTLAQAINAFCQSTVNTDGDLSGRFNCQVSLGRPTIYYKGNSSDRYPACRMLGLDNKWVGYRVMKTVLSGDAPVDMWGIQANQGYRIEFDGGAELLTEPFCWLGGHRVNAGEDLQGSDTSVQSTYPPNRLYLASSINVSTGGCVELANIDFGKELMHATFDGTLARVTADSARISVTAYDSTNNYVTLANLDRTTGGGHMRGDSEIRATQVFGVDGNIADFRDGLVSSSINANAGEAPFVTTSDVADWQTVIDAAATNTQLAKRTYAYNKPQKLLDIIEADLKLLGCYMTVDSDGKIAVAKFEDPADSNPDAISITDADILVSADWPQWQIEEDGYYNSIELSTSYDSFLDEYTGPAFLFRDTTSLGYTKQTRTLKIEPLSDPTPPNAAVDETTYSKSLGGLLTFFGKPYYVVTLKVPLTKFGAQLGSTVLLTSNFVPNPELGELGLIAHPCMLVGREWDLNSGVGTLTLYQFPYPSHGYAPAVRIDNAASTDISSGARTAYRFATVSNFYSPAGRKDLSYFAVGDPVNVQPAAPSRPVPLLKWAEGWPERKAR